MAARVNVEVLAREFVAVATVGPASALPAAIFLRRHRLKMRGVHAQRLAASVIEVLAWTNPAATENVGNAVGGGAAERRVPDPVASGRATVHAGQELYPPNS